VNTEQLEFNHWPADLEPVLHEKGSGSMVEETVKTYYPAGMKSQGDLFS